MAKEKVDKNISLNYFIPAARPLCTLGRRMWPRLQKSKIVAFGQFILIVFLPVSVWLGYLGSALTSVASIVTTITAAELKMFF